MYALLLCYSDPSHLLNARTNKASGSEHRTIEESQRNVSADCTSAPRHVVRSANTCMSASLGLKPVPELAVSVEFNRDQIQMTSPQRA